VDCLTSVADQFSDQTRNGLTLGAIYAMIAIGYTLVYGVLQLINFAHSEVFMVSTIVSLYAYRNWFDVTEPATGIALVLLLVGALIPAMIASGGTAVVLERLAYRPLRKRGAPRLAFLISAIGASLAIQYLFVLMDGRHSLLFLPLPNVLGPSPQKVPTVISQDPILTVFGAGWSLRRVLVIVVAVAMLIVADRFVNRTRLGRGIRATAQDSESAVLMGVNIDRVVVLTFLIGGAMAGLAGALYVGHFDPTRYIIGFVLGIKAFTAAVLGGIGNLRGALLGGLTIGLVENYGASIWGAEWKDVITFSILVLVLLFRPNGILGEALGRSKA